MLGGMACTDFWSARLTATETLITAYEEACERLAGGQQSYMLDTGQTVQRVTQVDLADLQATLDTLYNRYTMISARCNGGGTVTGRPAW
jgi:hypothetical protein